LLDLTRQRSAGAIGKPDVFPMGLRLAEVEGVAIEAQQQGEVGFRCRRRDVCAFRRGENAESAGMVPFLQGLRGHGMERGERYDGTNRRN